MLCILRDVTRRAFDSNCAIRAILPRKCTQIARAGDKLPIEQRAKLDQAKIALRQAFGR
jgi:hypothetical protein